MDEREEDRIQEPTGEGGTAAEIVGGEQAGEVTAGGVRDDDEDRQGQSIETTEDVEDRPEEIVDQQGAAMGEHPQEDSA